MVKLERSLGLFEVTMMSIGIIIGAGIYVVIGEAAGVTGNSLWMAFIIGAIVATFTGLSYAELSSRFSHAGAEYVYVQNSFGKTPAWIVGWLLIAGNIIGGATVALGFSNYFSALFNTPVIPIAIVVLLICGVILALGIKETASITILFTLIEAIGLFIIIFIGLQKFGDVDYLQLTNGIKGIIEGGVLIFFSYIGFQSITRLAEETKKPEKNIPKAIIISIIVTTIIYILVAIAAVSVIPAQDLAQEGAPLARIAETAFGQNSFILLSGIALFSTFNTALMMLLSGSRLVYGISKEKVLPKLFSKVSKKTRAPWIAVIGVVLAAVFFLFIGDLKSIANLTNFTVFAVFIAVNATLIYYRVKKPVKEGFKVPFSIGKIPILPVFGIITSVFMIGNLSVSVLLLGVLLIVIGIIVHFILKNIVKKDKR
jgi:APA family basic amino acid/polyamine antiporter